MILQTLYFKTSKRTNARILILSYVIVMTGRYHIFKYIQSSKVRMIIQSILLLALCVFTYFIPRWTHKMKLRNKSFVFQWAFIFGIFYLIIQGIAGIVFGFGKSPYRQDLWNVLYNSLIFGLPIISRELVRSYYINGYPHKSTIQPSIFLILIFTIIEYSIGKYTSLVNVKESVEFLGQYFMPTLAKQMLLTMLSVLGGPIPAIIYSVITEFSFYILPVLPNLNWLVSAFIGILTPIFSLFILQFLYKKELRQSIPRQDKENPITLIATVIVSIVIIWFSSGVFSIYPSVIATGSMEPMIYPGDVIIIRKINYDNINTLKEGDVIQFKRDTILISHRIIEIITKDGETFYKTKGDNNSSADSDLVTMENVRGIIKHVIPKIGWPTLILKRDDNSVEQNSIEF